MQDPYPATFQRRHHNISLGAVFFCLHVNNNLSNKVDKTSLSSYALKSDLDSSKLKSMTFTARSDEYAQITIGNPGILICAVSKDYLLVRQDNGTCRVIGNITQVELSFKRNVEVSGIAFYV